MAPCLFEDLPAARRFARLLGDHCHRSVDFQLRMGVLYFKQKHTHTHTRYVRPQNRPKQKPMTRNRAGRPTSHRLRGIFGIWRRVRSSMAVGDGTPRKTIQVGRRCSSLPWNVCGSWFLGSEEGTNRMGQVGMESRTGRHKQIEADVCLRNRTPEV